MRILEIVTTFCYLILINSAIQINFAWSGFIFDNLYDILDYMYGHNSGKSIPQLAELINSVKLMESHFSEKQFADYNSIHSWTGKSTQWLLIELMVFILYLGTLVIILIKSRFTSVSADNNLQFEPYLMSKLANRLIEAMDLEYKI